METIVDRYRGLVRVKGVPNWIPVAHLTPCDKCKGTLFRVGHRRLFCVTCLAPKKDEKVGRLVDLKEVREALEAYEKG